MCVAGVVFVVPPGMAYYYILAISIMFGDAIMDLIKRQLVLPMIYAATATSDAVVAAGSYVASTLPVQALTRTTLAVSSLARTVAYTVPTVILLSVQAVE